MLRALSPIIVLSLCAVSAGCTVHHSRQAMDPSELRPTPDAVFVSEEDSGLGIFLGLFIVSEPDHYAVLLERLRRRYRCARIHHGELEFRTDHWLLIAFPIARVTAICEPAGADAEAGPEARADAAPTAASPAPPPVASPKPAPTAASTPKAPTAPAAPTSPAAPTAADEPTAPAATTSPASPAAP